MVDRFVDVGLEQHKMAIRTINDLVDIYLKFQDDQKRRMVTQTAFDYVNSFTGSLAVKKQPYIRHYLEQTVARDHLEGNDYAKRLIEDKLK